MGVFALLSQFLDGGGIDMGDIGIGNPVSYRVFNVISISYICIKISMNPVSIIPIYRYRFGIDMGDFGNIGICLNILQTDTNILIAVSVYQYRSNSTTYPQ